MSLLGVAPGYAVIAPLLVTSGLSAAVLHSLAPVIAGRLSGHRLGCGMGFWMVGGELGRTVGPVIVVSAIALFGLEQAAFAACAGFTGLMATPVIMAAVQQSYPENRALANGVYMALSFGIRSTVVLLVGGVADRMGMRWTFQACALLAVVGTPFVFGLSQRVAR